AVYRASRRKQRLSLFTAGPANYHGGLNVAGGDFATQAGDEMAIAPADANEGPVPVEIWWAEFQLPSGLIEWTKLREFAVFGPAEKFNNVTIGAAGVNLAGGDLATKNDGEEIVVAPAAGLPVVRVFGRGGTKLTEWLAYPSSNGNSGVSVAVGDLDGEGGPEIITAPAKGQLWIRAWNNDSGDRVLGSAFEYKPDTPVSFFVKQFGLQFAGGLTVTTADVDLDGQAEIIVAPGAGASPQILAFEPNGDLVKDWVTYEPFGPLAGQALGLIGTDQFWKP